MPVLHVHLAHGRCPAQLDAMATAITDAVANTLQAPRESVRVLITEHESRHWYTGGRPLAERR